jgi:hypothetical protein
MVVPAGDCSIEMTRDCFQPGSTLCGRGGLAIASGDGFAAVVSGCAGRGDRFRADLDSEIPPRRLHGRGGASVGIEDSTALIAAECQSFLDNVIAQFDGVWAWNDRRGPNAGQSNPHRRILSFDAPTALGNSSLSRSLRSVRHIVRLDSPLVERFALYRRASWLMLSLGRIRIS